MSVVAPDPTKPQLLVNRVTRHHWGPDRRRVVRLVAIRQHDVVTARVYGVEGDRVVMLEESTDVEVPRSRAPRIKLNDGRVWEARSVGCSCNVPGPLRTFNALAAV